TTGNGVSKINNRLAATLHHVDVFSSGNSLPLNFAIRTYAEQRGLQNRPLPFFSVTKGLRQRGLPHMPSLSISALIRSNEVVSNTSLRFCSREGISRVKKPVDTSPIFFPPSLESRVIVSVLLGYVNSHPPGEKAASNPAL